jgi:transcriptional regulator with PAS, ATPase and Fis domain
MDWLKGINAAVTICDNEGIIVYMNEKSEDVFKDDGGKDLMGQSLFGCHPEPALAKLKDMLQHGSTNVYTIEKNGKKKLIYQSPWLSTGVVRGMIEISIELPADMEHFIRQ